LLKKKAYRQYLAFPKTNKKG